MAKTKIKPPPELTDKQKDFCRHYIFNWNGTQAAIKAGYSENTASEIAYENLRKPQIQAYIEEIQQDLEKQAGISRLMVVQETQKIAFSSIAHLHNTWITLHEFEQLTDDQKAAIAEISTQKRIEVQYVGDTEVPWEVDYVKIKLHDKMKGLDSLSKLLGYNAPEKLEVAGVPVKSYKISNARDRKGDTGK